MENNKIRDIKGSNFNEAGNLKNFSAGRDINVNQDIESNIANRELLLPNENSSQLLYLGNLIESFLINHRKKALFLLITFPSLSILYIINYFWIGFFKNNSLFLLSIFIFALGCSILELSKKSKCRKCKKNFAYEEVSRKLIKSGEYKSGTVDNIEITYRCRFCKDEYSILHID